MFYASESSTDIVVFNLSIFRVIWPEFSCMAYNLSAKNDV